MAAAFQYERSLDRDELVLIGDFGGGTSDFCLIELGPSSRGGRDRQETIRGVAGVPFAGDAFDGRLVRHVVAPKLGLGTVRRSEHGKELPIPAWIYARLERWEDVSFLATPQTLERLRQLAYQAGDSRRLESLICLVEDDLGYLSTARSSASSSSSPSATAPPSTSAISPSHHRRSSAPISRVDRGPARADGHGGRRSARPERRAREPGDRVF